MRLFILGLLAARFALPGAALGQALQRADLVGTWVHRSDGGAVFDSLKGRLVATYLTIDANGTYIYDGKIQQTDGQWRPYGIGWGKGTWSLAADTLRFNDYRNVLVAYKAARKDGHLFLWNWPMWDANRRVEQCAEKEFERFDPSTSLTIPPVPQVTIQYADLIGTWAGTYENKQLGPVSDTLVFDVNHRLRSAHIGWNPYSESDSNSRWSGGDDWMLLPGDELTGMGLLGKYRIALHNDELIPCNPVLAVLKRKER